MRKCDVCKKNKAIYDIFGTNKKICSNCIGDFFVCSGCGTVYERDDFENGDNMTGYCRRNCSDK